ncbi:MAG: hypothetical protein JXC85_03430 [Candidatus Aenigmarchaeota archaeon]|nr:hypothetical protein [Candidatus Aenigmarchaeota archaeon]
MDRDKKRKAEEWHDAIFEIIKRHGGKADYDSFYNEIPNLLHLNKRELRPSTPKANLELVWRGTLRGYLSDMIKAGILTKSGKMRERIFSIKG